MNSTHVRKNIVDALRLDLIGPTPSSADKYKEEVLSVQPSLYYLTGFLVPHEARTRVEIEEDESTLASMDDEENESDDNETNALIKRYPSSIGLSFLVKAATKKLNVKCSWGHYQPEITKDKTTWKRVFHEHDVLVDLTKRVNIPIPGASEVDLTVSCKSLDLAGDSFGLLEDGTQSVSLFLVNKKNTKDQGDILDHLFLFQAELQIQCEDGFCARPNLRALVSDDPDDCIADLQFSEINEYATGHGVAALFDTSGSDCKKIRTSWIPWHEVSPVDVPTIQNLNLKMEALSRLSSADEVRRETGALTSEYLKWIKTQETIIPQGISKRKETGKYLLKKYENALKRINKGLELLNDPKIFESFKLTNEVMAIAARKRIKYSDGKGPEWRTFQLAFLLMNIEGIARADSVDRETVDLLYFPTGGGKTEAYLGVAAFTLIYRRLSDPSMSSAGVSILMRYTLRLLTLDQLERATALICALELLRKKRERDFGTWPYEIGLWVGQAATPNKLGVIGDANQWSARAMIKAYKEDRGRSPVPLEKCPWCGEPFDKRNSFKFFPNDQRPTDLHIICNNRDCEFTARNYGRLPLVIVDEVIYQRLPSFIISTVDKLASMPWDEKIGKLFGKVDKHGPLGFYLQSEASTGTQRLASPLKPIDLIIQDELHLISGPLGTMVGLYETAVDELASRTINGNSIRPKVIASTATVRHAQKQVKALFARKNVDVFPVPGISSKDSFFAKVIPASESKPGRLYLGIAAQGRTTKNLLMRSFLSSMSAAQKQLEVLPPEKKKLADPYLTALGYFNSLRELGGARRIIEDEVNSKLRRYARDRKRENEEVSELVSNRIIKFDVEELTSRKNTAEVALAKHNLTKPYGEDAFIDVAIATNMISVGLDITRLGLMVVFGQPKSTAEYIQASSRVGRSSTPGLVVTLYNIHRHRDRSFYEKFLPYHQSYYRDVETTSVTPFSTKALDKGLAGTYLSVVRHLVDGMQRENSPSLIQSKKNEIREKVTTLLVERLNNSSNNPTPESAQSLKERLNSLLDDWEKIYRYVDDQNLELNYTSGDYALIHPYLDPKLAPLPEVYKKFRANRSMREVEPSVCIFVNGRTIED